MRGTSGLVGKQCGSAVDQTSERALRGRREGQLLLPQPAGSVCGCRVQSHYQQPQGARSWRARTRSWCGARRVHGPAPLPPSLAETRAGWITKINVFYDGKCIVGIKPTYGYSSLGAQLLGRQEGRSTDMALVPHRGNFITRAEARVGDRWGCGGGHANRARPPAS